jgi:hypothetical protein
MMKEYGAAMVWSDDTDLPNRFEFHWERAGANPMAQLSTV